MSFFGRLSRMFTKSGREEDLLQQAMNHAKAHHPEKALEIYDKMLSSQDLNSELRARILFNRALAHSSAKNDSQAQEDLLEVLNTPNLPSNIQEAARAQLTRVKKRSSARDA
jgi:hypothetical protein